MILPQYQRKGYGRFLIDFSKGFSLKQHMHSDNNWELYLLMLSGCAAVEYIFNGVCVLGLFLPPCRLLTVQVWRPAWISREASVRPWPAILHGLLAQCSAGVSPWGPWPADHHTAT